MSNILTLSKADRGAFDFCIARYNAGEMIGTLTDALPTDKGWDDSGDITFNLSDSQVAEMDALASEEEYFFPCFGRDLKLKMLALFANCETL